MKAVTKIKVKIINKTVRSTIVGRKIGTQITDEPLKRRETLKMKGDQFEETPGHSSPGRPYSEWPRTSIDYVLNEEKAMLSKAKPILKNNYPQKKAPHLLIRSAVEATQAGFQINLSANQKRARDILKTYLSQKLNLRYRSGA